MIRGPKKAVLALCGIIITMVLICVISKLWPFIALSSWQHGSQAKMHCWVKIVDQEGKGVQGYKCRVVEEHAPLWFLSSGKDTVRVFETGSDGTIEYKSRGATGRVFFGYDVREQWRINPAHLMQSHSLGVTSLEYQHGIQEMPTGYRGSKENPYLLNVIRVGSPQKLLYWKKRVRLEEVTNYVCVDVLAGRIWESREPEGDISIRDNPLTPQNIQEGLLYRFVAGENCGLYPVVDDWGLAPPINGYKQELFGSKDWQELRKQSGVNYAVYFRARDAQKQRYYYGRLVLGGSGSVGGGEVVIYANLQGERNLYYNGYTDFDRNREIRDFVSPPVRIESSEVNAP